MFDGYVNLPKNKFGLTKFDTFIYRTYTIIKDGILNLSRIPVTISQQTIEKLKVNGVSVETTKDPNIVVIDFSELPVVNRKMVNSSISAKKLAILEYELVQIQCLEKAYKHFEATHFPKQSQGFVDKYGKEAEEWLKGLGLTEGNGFNPSTVTEKGADFYMAPKLETKIAKHSTSPKITEVLDKIASKKPLNAMDELIKVAIDDYNTQITSKLYTDLTDEKLKNDVLKNWLKSVKTSVNKKRKELLQEIAQIKFSLILSKKWFEEFSSLDENTLTVKSGKNDLGIVFDYKEIQVNL
jgi:hypothetical protein